MAEYVELEAVLALQHWDGVGLTRWAVVNVDDIKKLPTANVAPVVKSKWEILTDDSGNEYMKCKRCGEEFYDGDNDTIDTKHNFCPNCGADMRER